MVRQLRDLEQVRRQAAHELARAVVVIELIAEALHVAEQVAADIGLNADAERVAVIGDDIIEERAHEIRCRHDAHDDEERMVGVRGQHRIDRAAGDKRENEIDRADEQRAEHVQQKQAAVRTEIRQENAQQAMLLIIAGIALHSGRLLSDNVLDPDAAAEHDEADNALADIGQLAAEEQRHDRQAGEAAEHKGHRHGQHADIEAVKQERHECLAAGAQGKIAGVGQRIDRHAQRTDADERGRKPADAVGRVIDLREQMSHERHHAAEHDADADGECDELTVCIDGFLHLPRAEQLADEDADGIAHGHKGDIEHVRDGRADVIGRDNIIAAHRVALRQQRHTCCPERFVQQERDALSRNGTGQRSRNVERAVHAAQIGHALRVAVCPEHDDTRLDKASDDRGNGRARGAETREAEIAEDQQRVEAEIHHNGHDARNHGHDGLARLAQRAGIALRQRERDKADEHDEQIFLCIAEAGRDLLR